MNNLLIWQNAWISEKEWEGSLTSAGREASLRSTFLLLIINKDVILPFSISSQPKGKLTARPENAVPIHCIWPDRSTRPYSFRKD